MGRPSYVCTVCSEHFTRKYSAKKHNLNIHADRSEIVPFIEYVAGRSSGKYVASHPSWYRKQTQLEVNRSYQSNFESPTVADPNERIVPPILLRLLQRLQHDSCTTCFSSLGNILQSYPP
jgi:hypothetical protein